PQLSEPVPKKTKPHAPKNVGFVSSLRPDTCPAFLLLILIPLRWPFGRARETWHFAFERLSFGI
ncbi:hypothetical protein, partial [Burkholderia stagnalis]|uniref:hypothetical protein n=1 Tax=Burkholderia stagnalis TaxID=1503054 RepID=UPI001C8955C1